MSRPVCLSELIGWCSLRRTRVELIQLYQLAASRNIHGRGRCLLCTFSIEHNSTSRVSRSTSLQVQDNCFKVQTFPTGSWFADNSSGHEVVELDVELLEASIQGGFRVRHYPAGTDNHARTIATAANSSAELLPTCWWKIRALFGPFWPAVIQFGFRR